MIQVVASTCSMIVCEDLDTQPPQAAPLAADDDEGARIRRALHRFNGNKTRAAASLGMARTTLWQKLRRLEADASGSNGGERPENNE
jgi:transcriptional regulator of acetoin/glycerol metabolism